MSLDDTIKALVRTEVRAALAEMFQTDRRTEPRPAPLALPAPRVRVRGKKKQKGPEEKKKREDLRCLADGCTNPFATRYGGWCALHRDLPASKAWARANAKKKGKNKK